MKVCEDTIVRRIDRQLLNRDNPNIKNTLKDLRIVDNSALLVEMRDQNEVEEFDEEHKLVQMKSADERIDIDSTENIRTVIVNTEFNKSNFERYQFNLDWTL